MKEKTGRVLSVMTWMCVLGGSIAAAAYAGTSVRDDAAEEPQKIVSIVKEEHPAEWYERQAGMWRARTEANPADEEAWWNLYEATRYQYWDSDTDCSGILTDILEQAGQAIPDSYRYYMMCYRHNNLVGGLDMDKTLDNMCRAIQMRPDNADAYNDYVPCLMRKGDASLLEDIMTRWYQSGTYSASLLNYSYNAMSGMDGEAIFFVNGDSPTYSALMVQYGKGLFPNIHTVCLGLLALQDYREAVCKDLGVVPYDMPDTFSSSEDYEKWMDQFELYLIKESGLTGYFSTAIPRTPDFKDRLYSEGLVLRYSEHRYNNLEVKRRNYENRYLTDYLRAQFVPESYKASACRLNLNYIPCFKSLLDWYKENDTERFKELYVTMTLIVRNAEIEDIQKEKYYDEIRR